jgi:arginine deiminase
MRHLPAARLVGYDPLIFDAKFALQKAQEQENQLRNQLKQNYMQIVSNGHLAIWLLSLKRLF